MKRRNALRILRPTGWVTEQRPWWLRAADGTDENLVRNAARMGAPALLSEMQSRQTLSF